MKRRIGLILFTLVAVATVLAIYGSAVKSKASTYDESLVGPTPAVLYYRGLGLTDDHAWYGCYRIRQVVDRADHDDRAEYLFDKNGRIYYSRAYYLSGALKAEAPRVEGTHAGDIGSFPNGCMKCYDKNGRLESESGIKYRTKHGDCSAANEHGPYRDYDMDGNLTNEEFFLEGRQCTREEWAEHLRLHPEDRRFGEVQAPGKMAVRMQRAIKGKSLTSSTTFTP